MFSKFSTRKRAIVASVLIGVIIFMLISPIAIRLYEFVFPPSEVKNISILQKNQEVEISWDLNKEYDLQSYKFQIGENEEQILDKQTNRIPIYNLENNQNYSVKISTLDDTGTESNVTSFTVTPSERSNVFTLNSTEELDSIRNVIITSIGFSAILFVLNIWVLFFKLNQRSILVIGAFPSFIMFANSVFLLSILSSVSSFSSRLLFSVFIAIIYAVLSYLLFLTSNILNGSLTSKLPLEQAAKAAQFIFSLIASYIILIYAFGSYQDILTRLLLTMPFIFYFTYSSIWMNKNLSGDLVFLRAMAVSLIMLLSLIVLSIWPIDSVYAILSASVFFYILLNVALETRQLLNRAVWVEYSLLTIIIVVLLFSNSVWGIHGSLI
jgi:hypothetical protein